MTTFVLILGTIAIAFFLYNLLGNLPHLGAVPLHSIAALARTYAPLMLLRLGFVDVKGNEFEVILFGAGRRICTGLSLGLRMVILLTATLVYTYNWELPHGMLTEKLNMYEAYGLTLQRATPLVVHPRPRPSPPVYKAFS